jgi:cysteine-rich repeat protein
MTRKSWDLLHLGIRLLPAVAVAAAVVGPAACGGGSQTLTPAVDADAAGGTDAPPGQDVGPDRTHFESIPPDEAARDLPPAEAEPACKPGEGCFGDPCAENADCADGFCVEHMGNMVCSQPCVEECEAGWTCAEVGGFGQDLVFVCISDFRVLCRPCKTNADCLSATGQEDLCLDYGPEGHFCGGSCGPDQECPAGYECTNVGSEPGDPILQCMSQSLACECSQRSRAMGHATICQVENESGICYGERKCTAEGLSDCDAATPAEEQCNGLDDDCDTQIDDVSCDDGNVCTTDSCGGAAGCAHEPLTGTNCDDGDICSVTDHCVDGECQGTPVACNDGDPCTDDSCNGLSGCAFEPNHEPCDDGEPCTLADTCSDGKCQGFQVSCQCQKDADCIPFEDGDKCNGTLFCDKSGVEYACAVEPATVIICPAPEGLEAPCLASACNPATGICSFQPAGDGYACDDGEPCSFGEACAAGKCGGSQPVNCNDGNPCTSDSCAPGKGCLHDPADGLPCYDGNPCTLDDHCLAGACAPGAWAECDDGNPCTDDACAADGSCVHTAEAAPCDDGNKCTQGDACTDGVCKGVLPVDCNDGNLCTDDSCLPPEGCTHSLNTVPCDDGSVCTTGDACKSGVCAGAGALTCEDLNACTDDSCDKKLGCLHVPNAKPCDDGNACTTDDQCSDGWCKSAELLACDDKNLCTDDWCDPSAGCQHSANANPCDDKDLCTTADACKAGQCVGGPALVCKDGNGCTTDSCAAAAGCVYSPNTLPCDDGNACTTADQCGGGACLGGPALPCNDGNGCTTDSCDPAKGCTSLPNSEVCDDGDACTTADHCAGGTCQGGPALPCSDGYACTTDSCDPGQGCLYTPVTPCCGNLVKEGGEDCDDGNTVGGDGCSAACKLETPKSVTLSPASVMECGAGRLDGEDHGLGSGYGCSAGDDLEIFRTGCTSCQLGGKTSNGVDLEFKPNLPAGAKITAASLLIRACPDDGYGILVKVFDYETGVEIGSCSIGPGGQVFYECTAALAPALLEADTLRIYTDSTNPNPLCDYMVYDFVKLTVSYSG